jgi:WhiB family redox-sensing transcriptional regulator
LDGPLAPVAGWRQFAACAGSYLEIFWPHPDANRNVQREATAAAKKICGMCAVKAECLEAGLREEYGVWGGLTSSERRHVAKR